MRCAALRRACPALCPNAEHHQIIDDRVGARLHDLDAKEKVVMSACSVRMAGCPVRASDLGISGEKAGVIR